MNRTEARTGSESSSASATVGSVSALWRFPVKSMLGERLETTDLKEHGLVGDRAYALVDVETGSIVNAKRARLFPDLLGCRAEFVEPPRVQGEVPPVRITLPDGSSVTSDSSDGDTVLSRHFGREIRLASTAALKDFTIDKYHPTVDPAFFARLEVPNPVPVGAFVDLFPVSVLTTSTLARLTELRPESRFDARRFRMNVIIHSELDGFVENDWIGRGLKLGDSVQLRIALHDPRCVMTNMAQEDLPKDAGILRTLARHNRLEVGAAGRYPCAGVYAVVESSGALHVGDEVVIRP